MKVNSEKIENCQIALNIEAEADEMEKTLDETYRRLRRKASISGFRKGKAPRAVLEQHIGKDTLLNEALEQLVPQLYKQAIELEKIKPVDVARIEFVQKEPLIFKAIVPLHPEVKLGEYHDVRVKLEPVKITAKDVKAAIENLRQERAVLLPVERPVQLADFVTINIKATVEDKSFLDHKDLVYEVNDKSNFPLAGFAANLVGMKKGEEKSFNLEIPDDYSIKEFCGKECHFEVVVTEIKEKQLPEVNDEFAQSCDYADLAQLKKQVKAYLKAAADERSRRQLRQKAIEAVVELSHVDYPPIFEDREIDAFLRDEARRLGYHEVEDYLKRINRTGKELRQELQPMAKKRITNTLVLDKVSEEEKIEISPLEVDNKAKEILGKAENGEKMQEFLATPQVRESIERTLLHDKTIDLLAQIASGTHGEGNKERGVDK
ncbi:MAG: trigger factor [Dehalococcoidia bacterium]|nr:trigger factor [Dehalococcoidia bacterium]